MISYNKEPKHIKSVKIMEDLGEKYSTPRIILRKEVIKILENHKKIIIVFSVESKWKKRRRSNYYGFEW